jgi:hypothetical protein
VLAWGCHLIGASLSFVTASLGATHDARLGTPGQLAPRAGDPDEGRTRQAVSYTEPLDHTSHLMLLEQVFFSGQPICAWRRATSETCSAPSEAMPRRRTGTPGPGGWTRGLIRWRFLPLKGDATGRCTHLTWSGASSVSQEDEQSSLDPSFGRPSAQFIPGAPSAHLNRGARHGMIDLANTGAERARERSAPPASAARAPKFGRQRPPRVGNP